MTATIYVPGRPVPKARPRVTRWSTYTPITTVEYEQRIFDAWSAAGSPKFPADTPLSIFVEARFPIPKGTSRRRAALIDGTWHTNHRGDVDNIIKAVQDALNGHAYPDDCAICDVRGQKLWSKTPGTTIIIQTIEEEPTNAEKTD